MVKPGHILKRNAARSLMGAWRPSWVSDFICDKGQQHFQISLFIYRVVYINLGGVAYGEID